MERVNVPVVCSSAVFVTKDDIAERNRQQMREGKGSRQNIGKYRSSIYAKYKNAVNPLAGIGNVDLILTGAFTRGIAVTVTGEDYNIWSSDTKTEDLVTRYGGQIFGLNPKNKQEYIGQQLEVAAMEQVRRLTGL